MSERVQAISGEVRTSRTIFALLFVVPILAVLLYGSTDLGALIPLTLLIGALAGIWIVRTWRSGIFELNANSIMLPVTGLLLLAMIQLLPLGDAGAPTGSLSVTASNALTLDPFATRIFVIRLAFYIVFLAAVLTFVDSAEKFRRAVAVILIAGGILAFVGILQKLASPDAIYGVRKHSGAKPFGPYVNSNHFASLMVLISGIAIAHLLGSGIGKQVKLLVGICAALMAIAVPFTSSRGGVIAYFAMLVVAMLAWFYRGKGEGPARWLPLVAGGAVLALIVVGSLLYLDGESSMLRGFGIENPSEDVSSGRFHFWSVAWKIFLANPIIGAGMDAFGVAFTQFDSRSGLYRVEQAHNEYLQMLADGGLVGFGIAVSFIFLLIRSGFKRVREESDPFLRTTILGGLAGCVGILVHSVFDFPLRTVGNAFVFLLVVGLVFAPVNSRLFKKATERGRSRLSSRREP